LSINNLQPLIEDWKASVVNSIGSFDDTERLAEYALHVSRILAYPNMSVQDFLHRIDLLGQELQLMTKRMMPLRPTLIIETMNNYLFKEKEFKPNLQDYYNPQNSYLNVVLEGRSGIPITLSIIYIRVGHFLNFKLYPVNFPGHFLVKHVLEEGETSEIIIDPFNSGRIMDDYALKELLDQFYRGQNIPLTRAFVEKATSVQVMTRLLNNLKGSYYESQNIDKAEIANEMIIAMEPDNPGAIRDKGMMLLKRKNHGEAISLLIKYLEIEPEAEDADTILEIIRRIRDGTSKKL
jgi:regulator of sirC expression with transglutaminase-like and TPR domain